MATFTAGFSSNGQYRLRIEVTQGTQSIDNNTTVVNYALYVDKLSGSGYWTGFSGNSSALGGDMSGASGIGGDWAPYDFRDYGSLLIASGSKTVTHNADGTKTLSATFSASDAGGGNFGSASGSISMTLTTIPRATTPTLTPNPVAVGSSVTIGLPRASDSFTHDVSYAMGSASGAIATGAGTSTSWTPPISLLQLMPSLMSAPVTITVVTKSGVTEIGTKTVTLTVTAPGGSPYFTPTILASVERSLSDGTPDPDGVCLLLHLDAAVASIDTGSEQNDLTYKVEAKPRGTSTWFELADTSAGGLTINTGLVYVEWDTAEEFATSASYDVRVTVSDEISSVAVSVLILATSEALLDVYKPTRALAIGSLYDPSLGGPLQILGVPFDPRSRTITYTTPSLADGATHDVSLPTGPGFTILHFESSHAARFEMYQSVAHRTADASRAVGVLPSGDHGLLFEEDGSAGAQSYATVAPGGLLGGISDCPVRIQNRSGATRTISVELEVVA